MLTIRLSGPLKEREPVVAQFMQLAMTAGKSVTRFVNEPEHMPTQCDVVIIEIQEKP